MFCFLKTPPQLRVFIVSRGNMVFINKLERIWKVIVGKEEDCGLRGLHSREVLL